MTSRRSFLGAIAAALVLDPERALWVPGAKKIFLPPAPAPAPAPVSGASLMALFNVGDVVTFGRRSAALGVHRSRRCDGAPLAALRPPFLESNDPPRGRMFVDVSALNLGTR